MNRKAISIIIFSALFSTSFISTLVHASFNKAPDGYSKHVVAGSNTIWVPENYTTIQEAVNNAREGETIFVRSGKYSEHVVVNKAVSLVGENKHDTIIDGNGARIVVYVIANNVNLSGFTIQNGELGIWFWYSHSNILTGNNFSNNQYGIYLWGSNDNTFTDNTATNNNEYGIYVGDSDNNVFSRNNVSNNQYGLYLEDSRSSILTVNNISNNDDGIFLYHSDNNLLSGNNVSNNQYGIYVGDSDNNVFSRNNVSKNQYGIDLYHSRDNILTGNTVSNNSYGISLKSSSKNAIFHNNFINNTEPTSSLDSVDSWDNGAEGNYWSDYHGTDANWNGIGDTQYPIDEKSLDRYPLMAMFLQFNIATETHSYKIDAVCSSAISNFRYYYDPEDKISAVSFKVNVTEDTGFCRICVPNSLIEPPHTVTASYNPLSYSKTVHTNGTHTWLYFTYGPSEHEITIMHKPPSEQLLLFRWTIFGLAIIIVILFSISVNYYRLFNKRKKVIEAYEREVGSFPVSHEERARIRFIKDLIEREEKIEKFKKKYGIKIQPASTLDDLMEKLGVQKES